MRRTASLRAVVATCAALSASALTARSRAQDADAVAPAPALRVLVRDDAGSRDVVDRVRAELSILGFAVDVVSFAGDARDPAALEAAAREGGAAAAIHVERTPTGAEAWIADRVTGKTVRRVVDADDPATIAIRVVELLRASLLEVRAVHPSRGEVAADAVVASVAGASRPPAASPPPADPSATTRPRRSAPATERGSPPDDGRVGAGVGVAPAMSWSAGGLPPAGVLDASAYVMPWPHVGIASFVQIPLGSVERTGAEGVRRSTVALAAVGVRFVPVDRDARWQPVVGAGIGAAWLRVEGEPRSERYVGSEQEAFAAVPFVRAGLSIRVVGPLRVATNALGGVALPRIAIDAAGRAADTWGHPVIGLGAGVEVATP